MKRTIGNKRKYLVIDHGNTRLKASVYAGDEKTDSICLPSDNADGLLEFAEAKGADRAIYACTARINSRLVESLDRLLPAGCLLLTPSLPVPLKIGYGTPETLGTDRIAAAVGARALSDKKNLMVVDAGTCITQDIIIADAFERGNISPGLAMRAKAMHDYAANLPLVTISKDTLSDAPFGSNTDEALRCGVIQGVVGELIFAFSVANQLYDGIDMVLTGGDAPFLSEFLNDFFVPHISRRDVVMLGLLKILQYNEDI